MERTESKRGRLKFKTERYYQLWHYLIIFCGELTGTAILLIFGCLGGMHPKILFTTVTVHEALAWGFTITTIVMIFGHITRAHVNPCVTTCALILRLITPRTALVYFAAQMIGAVLGFWLIYGVIPTSVFIHLNINQTSFCCTMITPHMNIFQGMLCEFLATSILIYAVCSAWDPRNSVWSDSVALKFGFVIASAVFTVGPYTGASLNPARSFGPALINNYWKNLWVYWISTLGAAIITTLIYKNLYLIDPDFDRKAEERLSDQLRRGSLYAKQENREQLRRSSAVGLPTTV